MTNKEAIERIKFHKVIHKMGERRAVLISEALDMAIDALSTKRKREKWVWEEKMSFERCKCSGCR